MPEVREASSQGGQIRAAPAVDFHPRFGAAGVRRGALSRGHQAPGAGALLRQSQGIARRPVAGHGRQQSLSRPGAPPDQLHRFARDESRNIPASAGAFIIADDKALVYRLQADRWDGISDMNDPAVVRRYLNFFDEVWQTSMQESQMRQMLM